uniref:Uncharacterized protein n=1 Tax=Glossina pallidipes TaxID=7398 RepID=A0A1B0A2R9_GLOPL
MNNSKPEDKFGDDLMIKAETSRQGADTAAKIIAICCGIRHILTPIAWVICTAIAYGAASLLLLIPSAEHTSMPTNHGSPFKIVVRTSCFSKVNGTIDSVVMMTSKWLLEVITTVRRESRGWRAGRSSRTGVTNRSAARSAVPAAPDCALKASERR